MTELKMRCPKCGTEMTISMKATERIEALRKAGVDVSNLFAMTGSNGGEYVASNKNGVLSILDDNDPIFVKIMVGGTIPNRRLFRRWVMAQMFYMLSYRDYYGHSVGLTEVIRYKGYEYQWKQIGEELYAQMKMYGRDPENFIARNRWFNKDIAVEMAEDYIRQLDKYVWNLKVKKCKGIPYKTLKGQNIFVTDLDSKVFTPLRRALKYMKFASTPNQLLEAVSDFDQKRIKINSFKQDTDWIDAYKGAGAYFTMQNMIRFHGCNAFDDKGKIMSLDTSLFLLDAKAEAYKNGEGWRLIGVLKKMLKDNNIDIDKKRAEWRKR